MNQKYKLLFFALALVIALPVAFSVPTTSSEFQDIDDPTYTDLLTVSNPSSADFNRLDRNEQKLYLFTVYNADFAEQYLVASSYSDPMDRVIAQRFYSESSSHINEHPDDFMKYLNQEGIDIRGVNGPVKSFDTRGNLKGKNQQVNVNNFKKSPMKDKYALEIDENGEIILIPKAAAGESGALIYFTGNMEGHASGTFILHSGTIEGVPVKSGYGLDFDEDGNLIRGTFNEFNGITFAEPTPVRALFGDYGVSMEVHDAQVVSVKEDIIDTYISGSASFPASGEGIESPLYIVGGNEFIVNGYKVKAPVGRPATVIRIGDPSWHGGYLEDAEATMGAFFGLASGKDEEYVQLGEETLVVSGDGIEVAFNGKQFAAGEEQKEEVAPAVDVATLQAAGVLEKGSKGTAVVALQQMLIEQIDPDTGQSYLASTYTTKSGAVVSRADGDFAGETDAAVRAWQEDNGLVADGKFGKTSTAKVLELSSAFSTSHYDSSISVSGGKTVLTQENGGIQVNGNLMTASLGSETIAMEGGHAYHILGVNIYNPLDIPVEYLPREDDGTADTELGTDGAYLACISCTNFGKYVGEYETGAGQYAARRVVGEVAAVGITALDEAMISTGAKQESPYSVAFFQHYIAARGDELVLQEDELPDEWKDWVVNYAETNKGQTDVTLKRGDKQQCTGTCYVDVSPYNVGLYDLQNSFGHFDLEVLDNEDGSKTYDIIDSYAFARGEQDTTGIARHGFGLGALTEEQVVVVNTALPTMEFSHPSGAYNERFEVENLGGKTYLMIPQQFLEATGKEYKVRASFTIPPKGISTTSTAATTNEG